MHCVNSQAKYLMFCLQLTLGWPELRQLWWTPHMSNSSRKLWERTFWTQTRNKRALPHLPFPSPPTPPRSLCLSLRLCLPPSFSLFLVTAHLPSHFSLPFLLTHYSLPLPLSFPLFFPFPRVPLGDSCHFQITKCKTVLRTYGSNDGSKHLLWWTVMWHLKCLFLFKPPVWGAVVSAKATVLLKFLQFGCIKNVCVHKALQSTLP